MTTAAARRVGGTTKFVPWTTSTAPVHHSAGAASERDHTRPSTPAGIGRDTTRTPTGTTSASAPVPRAVRP